jgi:hypothetical protein
MAQMAYRALIRAAGATFLSACLLAVVACAPAGARLSSTVSPPSIPGYSVGLEQCVPSAVQAERSATFTAEMVATSETQRMGIRIELQQRLRGESSFHTLVAPGFGIWRSSEPGVKIYKYVKQVTNLGAPAAYRAIVRFRWLGEKGRPVKHAELHTLRCLQPMLSGQAVESSPPTPSS